MLINASNRHPLNILDDDGETVIATVPAGQVPARIITTTAPAPAGGHELVSGVVAFGGFEGLPTPVGGDLVLVSIATAAAYVAAVRAGEVPARDDLVVAGRNVTRPGEEGRTIIIGCVGLTAVAMPSESALPVGTVVRNEHGHMGVMDSAHTVTTYVTPGWGNGPEWAEFCPLWPEAATGPDADAMGTAWRRWVAAGRPWKDNS